MVKWISLNSRNSIPCKRGRDEELVGREKENYCFEVGKGSGKENERWRGKQRFKRKKGRKESKRER